MRRIAVTGADGFIGRNLRYHLARTPDTDVVEITRRTKADALGGMLAGVDAVVHLAGVNRPEKPADFDEGNARFTERLCELLAAAPTPPRVIFASSMQVEEDNPYGRSKRAAEEALERYAKRGGAAAVIFRLTNVFGKWCRPRYNSVVATFCHAIARGESYTVNDPARVVRLVYIDDVVRAIEEALEAPLPVGAHRHDAGPVVDITLGDLADRIESFRASRRTAMLPDLAIRFNVNLYATYLSYLEGSDFAYGLDRKTDPRGVLAEFVKSAQAGQIFVSRTHPGITRGNHFHHTKTEKFLVVEGKARVRFRHIDTGATVTHDVDGAEFRVVDIPPAYTHSIENIGPGQMVVVFWASEIFDPNRPDTYALTVEPAS